MSEDKIDSGLIRACFEIEKLQSIVKIYEEALHKIVTWTIASEDAWQLAEIASKALKEGKK